MLLVPRERLIACKVTGERAFSKDLPQGGLQVPCILTFRGGAEEVCKIVKLLNPPVTVHDPTSPLPTKKRKT